MAFRLPSIWKVARFVLLLIAVYMAIGYVTPRLRWITAESGAGPDIEGALPLSPAGVDVPWVLTYLLSLFPE